MNNYLFANIATGKLTGKRGGGAPVFTVGEQNPTQIYFLDYAKPGSYPSSIPPLGDAYSFSTNPVNKNSSSLTIRAGSSIGQSIVNQSSWANLPSVVNGTFTGEFQPTGNSVTGAISLNGEISLSPTPVSGVFRIRTSATKWVYLPYFASENDVKNAIFQMFESVIRFTDSGKLDELDEIPIKNVDYNLPPTPPQNWVYRGPLSPQFTADAIFPSFAGNPVLGEASNFNSVWINYVEFINNQERYNKDIQKYNNEVKKFNQQSTLIETPLYVSQTGDFSFYYNIIGFTKPGVTINTNQTFEIDTSTLLAPTGKYANLDFSSPSWNTLLGSENEKEVWLDAVLDNRVVAQGRAIIRKKLSV
jgi:hypothetical protein